MTAHPSPMLDNVTHGDCVDRRFLHFLDRRNEILMGRLYSFGSVSEIFWRS
jgi:hypothetical protein